MIKKYMSLSFIVGIAIEKRTAEYTEYTEEEVHRESHELFRVTTCF